MPGTLKYFNSKPTYIGSKRWEGRGYYYNRGHGKWTKWSRTRDIRKGSHTTVGIGKRKHTHDKRKKR